MNLFYDRKENKESIYQMYQQIFEDPEAFAQYYFREIYPHNQVLLAAEDDEIKGMIHLNPYNIKIGIEEQKLNYIVAVAVREEFRRQGIMAKMLKKCLNDMAGQRQPFTYLMPANRAYYEPFDFVFIMDWNETVVKGKEAKREGEILPAAKEEYEDISVFLTSFMEEYGVYTIPDIKYLKLTEKESNSCDGDLMVWKRNGEIAGVFAQGLEEDTVFLRWAFSIKPEKMLQQIQMYYPGREIEITGGNLLQGENNPKIMARITSLQSWEKYLKGDESFRFQILVEDSLIKDNQGTFQFEYQDTEQKMTIRRIEEKEGISKISIGDLTQVFFGYHAEKILEQYECLRSIIPVGPVYISEEV